MSRSLVYQTDFGTSDGAVAAMYGVALKVDPALAIFDLTHDIPKYNIWEASYRLVQTVQYWPAGTVFVSVVDPGVGSSRRSVAVKTAAGQIVVTPDNGTLTHLKLLQGVAEARLLVEDANRLSGSELSYTFHGRTCTPTPAPGSPRARSRSRTSARPSTRPPSSSWTTWTRSAPGTRSRAR